MLNELLLVERGAAQAGITLSLRHPEIKDSTRKPTLHVCLDSQGHVARLRAIASSRLKERPLWKLSEGQKNSFPFVQPKAFWNSATIEQWKHSLGKRPTDSEKRETLLRIASESTVRDDLGEWAAEGMTKALRKRRKDLIAIERSNVAALPAAIDRFLLATDRKVGGNPRRLVLEITKKLFQELRASADSDLLETAVSLCTESDSKGGALYFDVEGDFPLRLIETGVEELICAHLRQIDIARAERRGICSITGEEGVLVVNTFSQPNLPTIQQSFLFARNEAIPSATRYVRTSAESILVGYMTDVRLRAAIEALCSRDRNGKTWRAIPGEAPKQNDLLLAFVHEVIDAPTATLFMEKEEDLSEEEGDTVAKQAASVAAFEERAKRLIEAVKANVTADWRNTPVSLAIFRKVDPANRKVIYTSTPTVSDLYGAAVMWIAGERNIPYWLKLPVFIKGKGFPIMTTPRHVAPLEVTALLKKIYIRGGTDSQEITGLPASEILRLFLDPSSDGHRPAKTRARRVLHLILSRRAVLLAGVGQALHTPESWQGQRKAARAFNGSEALRTATLMGVLLHKLNRTKEVYMNETAFKLGQLLAAADVVHAGYCADVRGGDVPPSLLGNQVFAMAQSDPNKALATLCRRWKPYDGWAKKASRNTNRVSTLIASSSKDDQRRGWDIRKALRYAREIAPLAAELAPTLEACRVNDIFLAELLLGYMAGFPKTQRDDGDVADEVQDDREEE